jgi:hypothetical protein
MSTLRRRSFTIRRAAAGLVLACLLASGASVREPVRVIFDTDLGADVDDVGAVAVLHALADRGEAQILAMGISIKNPWSAPCLDALNTYFGRPDIPIGVPKGDSIADTSKYARGVAEEFPHDLKSADDAPDVVAVYREALAGQPDGSVVFVSVGFLTNAASLLTSGPDRHSPLTGAELIRRKVQRWVCMGGGFPSGHEYNVLKDAPASRKAIGGWPTPIAFSGFEIGEPIQTGATLKAKPRDNPVRRAYELYNGLANRSSWDQTAVLYAVRGIDAGPSGLWDVHPKGSIEVLPDGRNRWRDEPDRGHSYLLRQQPPARVAEVIEGLMMQSPHRTAN